MRYLRKGIAARTIAKMLRVQPSTVRRWRAEEQLTPGQRHDNATLILERVRRLSIEQQRAILVALQERLAATGGAS